MLTEEQKKQIDVQNRTIAENLLNIKHRIVVFSGKGGVGKTTVSVNLAYGLRLRGYKTGILDADVTGPDVPNMLGIDGQLSISDKRLIPQEKNGVKVVSFANVIPPDQPVIWRGPMRSKALFHFLGNVEWGRLDYLIADLPPGTGDEIITMTQIMEPDLAIVVTTPQNMSLVDSRRAINMAYKMNIPNTGVIENMSGLCCPKCGYKIDLFSVGGGRKQAEDMGVEFLGQLPIDPEARILADQGIPIILENAEADISLAINDIVKRIEKMLN